MKSSNSSITDNDVLTAKMESRLKQIQKEKRNYWKAEEEVILKDWADKAQCYEWMHLKAHEKYKSKKTWFTIPVIIISTITGTANFAQERFGKDMVQYVVMIIGTLNLIAAIITTIYQFLKISELNESYRMSALSWGKYYRTIKTELLKHPLDRKSHEQIVKYASEEYNRLIEISPLIPTNIIQQFNKKFDVDTTFKKPEICTNQFGTDIFIMTNEERENMVNELFEDENAKKQEMLHEIEDMKKYNTELKLEKIETETNLQKRIDENEHRLLESQEEIERKNIDLETITKRLLDTIEVNNKISRAASEQELSNKELSACLDDEENEENVNDFIETFLSLHGRVPDEDEIKESMRLFDNKTRRDTENSHTFIKINIDDMDNINNNYNNYNNDNEDNEDDSYNNSSTSHV